MIKIEADPALMQVVSTPSSLKAITDVAPPRVVVSIATYNEAANILALIDQIHASAPNVDVVVIDDNSPDGTWKLVEERGQKDARVHLIRRPGKLGLGTAILRGMQYAMEGGYDLMINMDADFSHPPQAIPSLIRGMKSKDVMIGSRYIPGGGSRNWPMSRQWMSWGVNMFVRLAFRMQVRDASGGYRCYRVAKLRAAHLDQLISRGYSFQQEVLYRCYLAGCRLGETPIIFENRKHGKSKVSLKETVRSLSTIVYLGFRAMLGLDKARYRPN